MNNAKKGFTLVELLVVIAILAILATVSVVGYTSFIDRAEQSNIDTELHQIETTIKSYTFAQQEYVIATKGTTEYVVKVDSGVVSVGTWTEATEDTPATFVPLTSVDGLTWTDFEEVKDGFKLDATGKLTYHDNDVNIND